MRPLCLLLAATALLSSQPAFAATKETYAHKMEMGQLLYFNGDVDRAIKAFQRAGELNPKAFEPHLNLVNLYVQKGGDEGIEKAQLECQEVLKLKPQNKEVHLILGNLLRTQAGNITDKDKMIAKLDEAAKEIAIAEDLGAPAPLCENTIGLVLLQKGDYAEALKHIDVAIAKQPVFADAHLIRAILLFKTLGVEPEKLKEEAMKAKVQPVLDELDLAIKQKDKNAEAHNTKADILFGLGRHEDAAKEYEEATKDEPRYAQAWAGLGNTHAQLASTDSAKKDDHISKARDAYDKAKKLRPDDKNMIYGLAVMLEKQGAYGEALQEFQSGVMMETDPVMKAQIMMHMQQLQGASGGAANLGLGAGAAGTSAGMNNVFTRGALSVPFSQLIKVKEPKEKAAQ